MNVNKDATLKQTLDYKLINFKEIESPAAGDQYYFVLILALITSLLWKNPFLSLICAINMHFILKLFWRKHQIAILLFCLLWHWLQIYASVWEANYFGQTMNQSFPLHGYFVTILASIGLVSLSLGIYSSINNAPIAIQYQDLAEQAKQINPKKAILLYVGFSILSNILERIAFSLPLFSQILIYISKISLVLYFVLGFTTLLTNKYYYLFILTSIYEFITGFYSYFADFKIVIFAFILSVIPIIKIFDIKKFLLLVIVGYFAVFALNFWQTIKNDYREFIGGGQTQVVNSNFKESLEKLAYLAFNVKEEELDQNVKLTFRRVGYLEFFSIVVNRVPAILPYEKGDLLLNNLSFVFIPRFINPNKGIKNDTEKTQKYTGKIFYTKGSSFSLGYFTEAYIDFGPFFMMPFLYILGLVIGRLYTIVNMHIYLNVILKSAIISVVFLAFQSFETDSITLYGQLFWGSMAHFILLMPVYKLINGFIMNAKDVEEH